MENLDWFFTFGVGEENGNRAHKYVHIRGTYDEARAKMQKWYGSAWCGQYDMDRINEQIRKFGISEYTEGIDMEDEP